MKRLVRLPGSPARSSADVDAELAFHLDGRIEELMARGMTRDDAEREAMRRFGDPATVRAEMERIDTDTRRRTAFRDMNALLLTESEAAKRFGGGKSSGMQRDSVSADKSAAGAPSATKAPTAP